MCTVWGTKLYGLRMKKDSQIKTEYGLNISKVFKKILGKGG